MAVFVNTYMAFLNSKKWLIGITFFGAVISMTQLTIADAFDGHTWSRTGDKPQGGFYTQRHQNDRLEPLQSRQYSQSRDRRSRSEVVQEVKRRHPNAEILRIKFDERAMVYRVRVYLKGGVVKVVTVTARR